MSSPLISFSDVDFAYANEFGRFRASVVSQRLGYDITFRIINTEVRRRLGGVHSALCTSSWVGS